MPEQPSHEQILAALESGGFLLEQRVAEALEERGYSVRVNPTYTDPDEKSTREIDVIASRPMRTRSGGISSTRPLVIVIECKSTPMPHIGFVRPWTDDERRHQPWELGTPWPAEVKDEWAISRLNRTTKVVGITRIERDGKSFKARNVLNEIGLPPIKAAYSTRRDYSLSSTCFVAAVVGGSVFAAASERNSSPSLTAQPFVSVIYDNRAAWARTGSASTRHVVDVVSFEHINEWLDHIDDVSERLEERLQAHDSATRARRTSPTKIPRSTGGRLR